MYELENNIYLFYCFGTWFLISSNLVLSAIIGINTPFVEVF